jgi:hypothetical protein
VQGVVSFVFMAMQGCVLAKTLANRAIQVFGLFRVFGEQPEGRLSEQRETEGQGNLIPVIDSPS